MGIEPSPALIDALARFHAWIDAQSRGPLGAAGLGEFLATRALPPRGVYFFLDPAEDRGNGRPRVVRVGTHALGAGAKSTLRQRLQNHRGKTGEAGGNHRGSIFRLLVGQCLIASGDVPACRSWGLKSDPKQAAMALGESPAAIKRDEAPVERAVSTYIGRLAVTCIGVDDPPGPASARGAIERGAIALLSAAAASGLLRPGEVWLGRRSNRSLVAQSGLWNQNHVGDPWSVDFLDLLDRHAA